MELDTGTKRDPWWKRTLLFIGGILGTHGFSYVYDYAVYPIVTYKLGLVKSFIVLFIIILVINYFMVLLYDYFKKDLFGFEEIKKIKARGGQHGADKLLHKIMRWGDTPFFLALSFYDPIFAVLYKRESTDFDGFKKRDYWILLLSTAIGCIFWSLIWSGGIYVFKEFINLL